MNARRYQLKKDGVAVVERGHPWLFREQMSSAALVFEDGDWVRLVDGANQGIGYGIYEAEGAIAVRILRAGPERPDAAWVRRQLAAALAKRAGVAGRTNALRLVNGESDGLAAIVVDRFADTIVVASYSAGADGLARYIAMLLAAAARGTTQLDLPAPISDADAAITQPIEILRDEANITGVHQALDTGMTMPIASVAQTRSRALPLHRPHPPPTSPSSSAPPPT